MGLNEIDPKVFQGIAIVIGVAFWLFLPYERIKHDRNKSTKRTGVKGLIRKIRLYNRSEKDIYPDPKGRS
jgi:hypothetical protein